MEYPITHVPPITIDPQYLYRGEARPTRHTDGAGTKHKCRYCGTPTYRSIGGINCCSACTAKGEADAEKNWTTQTP